MYILKISDVLAELEVIKIHGIERISEPYEFELEVLSSDSSLAEHVGKEATLTLVVGHSKTFRHGILNRITVVEVNNLKVRYQLSLVPAVKRLELKSNCRIFQEVAVEDVLKTILEEHNIINVFKDVETRSVQTYLVQYRETDFEFLQRLMEQEGLFYYFEYQNDSHTLIIADQAAGYPAIPGRSRSLRYKPTSDQTEGISAFSLSSMETTDAPALSAEAITNSLRLAPGYSFKLVGHRYPQANQHYVCVEVIHKTEQDPRNQRVVRYQNNMKCISVNMPYRSEGRYPALIMQGPQTATVVGPAGEEIFVDEQGRVKVQFQWDQDSQLDEHSSAWIRVAQASAGKGWGHLVIPRIGNEVLVDFVDGDPDQPVIIGSLYNDSNPVPYPLPDNKTVTALKSQTSPGGNGFNELRFDDKANNERVLLRAQKDLSMSVNNNFEAMMGSSKIQVNGDLSVDIGKRRSETLGSAMSLTVGASKKENVGTNYALTVGNNQTSKTRKQYSCTVGDKATLTAKSILLQAKDSITIKVGRASIVMNKNGVIQIKGKQIDIKASGNLTLKGTNIR